MYQIAVCDDDEYTRKNTMQRLMEYSIQNNMDYHLDEFSSGEDLLKQKKDYDLIFMDYDFKDSGANGMEISREYRKQHEDSTIIFLSSYSSVVFESFSVNAFRFLVKPLNQEAFQEAMDEFVKKFSSDRILMIKVDGSHKPVYERHISYCEAFGKYSLIHTTKETMECHETLATIEEQLSKDTFFRVHKSYVVNLRYVESFQRTGIRMSDGENIPISRMKYKDFVKAMGDYIR